MFYFSLSGITCSHRTDPTCTARSRPRTIFSTVSSTLTWSSWRPWPSCHSATLPASSSARRSLRHTVGTTLFFYPRYCSNFQDNILHIFWLIVFSIFSFFFSFSFPPPFDIPEFVSLLNMSYICFLFLISVFK